jgi:hypothetical protein
MEADLRQVEVHEAVEACDKAIHQLEQALQFDKK